MSKRTRPAVNYAEPPDLSDDDDVENVGNVQIEQVQNKRRKIDNSASAFALVPSLPKKQRKTSKGKKLDETKFEFFKLPGEIRNRIYRYAFTSELPISFMRNPGDPSEGCDMQFFTGKIIRHLTQKQKQEIKKQKDIAWHFLGVCKQIHKEATPLMYQYNLFSICFHETLMGFIDQYPMHVSNLRHLDAWFRIDKKRGLSSDVRGILDNPALANLDKLDIIIDTKEKTLEAAAQKFYDVARVWIKRIGERENDQYAALKVLHVQKVVLFHSSRNIWVCGQWVRPFMKALEHIMAKDYGHLKPGIESQA